jgi:hypothetical protein
MSEKQDEKKTNLAGKRLVFSFSLIFLVVGGELR